ncbi:MAG: radical SAM protein [Candidatus Avigastranaerophilus sp.]
MIYKSCDMVEHGLAFTYDNILLCCLSNEKYIIEPDFEGKTLDLDKIVEQKRALRERFRSGDILPQCKNCHNLKEQDWDDEDYINNLFICHWTKCNCDCFYCYYADNKPFFQKVKSYNFMKILNELKKKNLFKSNGEINIAGGEPTVLKEIDSVIEFCLKNGARNITVNSNCIDYKKSIAKALNKDKLLFTVSLDCSDREMYKKIKRRDAFDRVIRNLKKYIKAQGEIKHNVRVKYIILPGVNDSIEQVEKWITLCYDIGVKQIILDLETNYYLTNKNNIPDNIYEIIKYTEKKAKDLGIMVNYYSHILQIRHENGEI